MYFVNDALPTYWLCRALLEHLTAPPPPYVPNLLHVFLGTEAPIPPASSSDDDEYDSDSPNRLIGTNLKEMLTMARHFVGSGEGLGMPMPHMSSPNDVDTPGNGSGTGGPNDPNNATNYMPSISVTIPDEMPFSGIFTIE